MLPGPHSNGLISKSLPQAFSADTGISFSLRASFWYSAAFNSAWVFRKWVKSRPKRMKQYLLIRTQNINLTPNMITFTNLVKCCYSDSSEHSVPSLSLWTGRSPPSTGAAGRLPETCWDGWWSAGVLSSLCWSAPRPPEWTSGSAGGAAVRSALVLETPVDCLQGIQTSVLIY